MKLNVSLKFSECDKYLLGILSEVARDSVFEYDLSFFARGIEPAPFKLPVSKGLLVHDQRAGMETFGIFEDSLPDGWGRRLIDLMFKKKFGRLPSVLERLSCVGDGGIGALSYEPTIEREDIGDFDLSKIAEAAMDFDAGRVEDVLPAVRVAGGSSGGARPKAFIGYNPFTGEACPETSLLPDGFEHWIVKFNTKSDGVLSGEMEYQYYLAAIASGVEMSECRVIETEVGRFFATRRFDRTSKGERLHFASAAGLLHADFRLPGDEYSILFRLTDALTRDYSSKKELFRRAALNVLAHNRDDHLKNFGFLMDAKGKWRLAPFYDFTHSQGPNGWQTLSVAGEGANPREKDLLRLSKDVGLSISDASEIIERVRCAIEKFNLLSF